MSELADELHALDEALRRLQETIDRLFAETPGAEKP